MLAPGSRQLRLNLRELFHEVRVNRRARALGWRRSADGVGLGHERDVPEQIDPVPVAEGSEESRFSAVLLDGGLERAGDAMRGERIVRRLTQELVGQRRLEEDPVIHRLREHVERVPGLLVHVGDADIAPSQHGFVGRQLLHFPVEPQILGEPAVDALDVGVPVAGRFPANGESRVQLGHELLVRGWIVEDVGARDGAYRLDGRIGAGSCGHEQKGGGTGEHRARSGVHVCVPSRMVGFGAIG